VLFAILSLLRSGGNSGGCEEDFSHVILCCNAREAAIYVCGIRPRVRGNLSGASGPAGINCSGTRPIRIIYKVEGAAARPG
jgi:hypothetical protein